MLQFFKKPSEDNDVFVALDLGTESVKAAIFAIEEKLNSKGDSLGRIANILALSKQSLRSIEAEWGISDVSKVIQASHEVAKNAMRQAGAKPSGIVLGIDGSFVKGRTSIHKLKRDEPKQKINLTELRNIVHKLQWSAFEKVRKLASDEIGHEEINTKLVMADIIDIKIDGYQITNPLGFQGKEIQMSIFNCFAPIGHYNALQKIIHSFEMNCLGIVPSAYSFSGALRGDKNQESSHCIVIDIGGNSTDMTLVLNNILMGSRSFGVGGGTFSKRIAVELNISLQEAEKLKRAYAEDRIEQKSKKIINTIMAQDIETWLEGVVICLDSFGVKKDLPSKIILSGGGTLLPEIREVLNATKWYKSLSFKEKPHASYMNMKELINITNQTKKTLAHTDFTIASLVNSGLMLSKKETLIQKALKKVVGIMKV